MDDHCIVCAEPISFTAFGVCGHKETCSKCVARLRAILRDTRCAYCQQQLPIVFVTRFAGGYTQQLSSGEFERLQTRAKSRELSYLDSAQAYFDDTSHYEEIRALCSFTHPLAAHNVFSSLRSLRSYIQSTHKRQFCEICLEGRKVFISEQLTYDKPGLERHMRQGDVNGPLEESGFKGHPECRFCHKRFYGENELYQHMHSTHEECFLCRRSAPHRHIYYRDYADLENHFRQDHFPCEHPECLEHKFVVFLTEQELKTHTARQHGETLAKHERKAALTLSVAFNYRSGGEQSSASTSLAAVAASGRGAVVIGGAASIPSQLANSQRRGSRTNLDEASAGQGPAPVTTGVDGPFRGLSLRDSEFPSMGDGSSSLAMPAVGGQWAGAAGRPQGRGLSEADFPALPGTSKSAKRRAAKSKKQTAAQVVGSSNGSVRVVINNTTPRQGPENFPPLGQPAGLPRPPSTQEIAEPASSSVSSRSSRSQGIPPQQRAPPASGDPLPSGISEALRNANRELVDKIKKRLGNDDAFAEFRQRSAAWVKGEIDPEAYHAAVASMGLVSLVPELASTCPDAEKRTELLRVHATAFSSEHPNESSGGLWMPPEAAIAGAAHAAANSSWRCDSCTLINAPAAMTCEACGRGRPPKEQESRARQRSRQSISAWARAGNGSSGTQKSVEVAFPALPSASRPASANSAKAPAEAEGSGAAGKGKKAKGKQPLSDFMTQTASRSHTQNPWRNPALRGQWASEGGGSLAAEERAMNDSWSKS